ncbi:MAG: cellulase family glycosylhydrolase [Roseitalea sp.]|nr:cellulase family glycosylhydrolase [Roseitalea sp.]
MIASLRAVLTVLIVLCALPAAATVFEVRRAISTNLWVEWPDISRWNDAVVVACFPEWRRHLGPEDFADLKAAGFDTIRMPLEPAFFLHNDDPKRLSELLAGMDRAIATIRGAGLKVIVDLHTIPRGDGDDYVGTTQLMTDDALFDRYVALVARMSGDLSRWPAHMVALEVINEPTLDCYDSDDRARWQARLESLHGAARATNGDITLVLTGACWGSADGLAAVDPRPIDDANTLWSFHSYEPFFVTHQGATWGGDIVAHLRGIPWPPDAVDAAAFDAAADDSADRIRAALSGRNERRALNFLNDSLRAMLALDDPADALAPSFETVAGWADEHGIARDRIFMGEFGMIGREWGTDLDVPAQYRLNYMRAMIGQAEAHGFSWSVWSLGGAFGLMQGYSGERLEMPLYDQLIWTLTD